MSEWWTYGLSDFLMFSPDTYWRLVERYNRALWPLQLGVVAAGSLLVALAAVLEREAICVRMGIGEVDGLQRLWTPYRMAYIRKEATAKAEGSQECPFCVIPAGDDRDGLVIARGEHCYAVLNLHPSSSATCRYGITIRWPGL